MRDRFWTSICGTAVALVGITAASAASHAKCTRLALSDVAFGKPAATAAAREKLAEYAAETARKRGWPSSGSLAKSNETVSCKVYLDLGPVGTEYRCLVTATFCRK
jgi:hypothetical protein